MISYLFYFFLAYLLYQLVFKFIIPVYRTTRQVKQGFRSMQQKMNAHAKENAARPDTGYNSKKESGQAAGEYIDFEEVKK